MTNARNAAAASRRRKSIIGMNQAWYDPDRQEWRTDRDWNQHYDWDRDRDRYDH